jgi:hypothetical protein
LPSYDNTAILVRDEESQVQHRMNTQPLLPLVSMLDDSENDEKFINPAAERLLQDLHKRGFVQDSGLEKKVSSRPSSKEVSNNRVRNKLKAATTLARLSRQSASNESERQSYESAVSMGRSTCDESGRVTSRRTFEVSMCASDEDGNHSYESTPRPTLGSLGRNTSACESLVLDATEFTELETPEKHFLAIESESRKYLGGGASVVSPPYQLPPLRGDHLKDLPVKGWDMGKTPEVTKARSTAQSFLAERGLQPIKTSQQKGIPVDILSECLHSKG